MEIFTDLQKNFVRKRLTRKFDSWISLRNSEKDSASRKFTKFLFLLKVGDNFMSKGNYSSVQKYSKRYIFQGLNTGMRIGERKLVKYNIS